MTEPSELDTPPLKMEVQVFDAFTAAKIAESFGENFKKDRKDPNKDIPPSLLSAEDIDFYVRETGLIGPYFEGGGKKSRLKKAAYEGRIGQNAYRFNELNQLVALPVGESLKVQAESIVFVECDLEFRLPEFIALRFNLQIRHVHRGLLLGTGPLVDPGYWGKLCIPLHNLTDQDYVIPRKEGLIWLEFTKTTSNLSPGQVAKGRPPLEKQFWNIRDFIDKAGTLFGDEIPSVPIRSSIPTMVADANSKSANALLAADRAVAASLQAAGDANAARVEAVKVKDLFDRIGLAAAAAAVIAVVSLWGTFWYGTKADYNTLTTRLDGLQNSMSSTAKELSKAESDRDSAEAALQQQEIGLAAAVMRVRMLEEQNQSLEAKIMEIQANLDDRPASPVVGNYAK